MDSTRPSLLVRIKDRHDADAWREFYDLYSPLLYSYACNRGLCREDAEDIQASCFETIVKQIENFQYNENNTGFRAWLRTMVNRRVIDLLRKRKMVNADSHDLRDLPTKEDAIEDLWEKNWRQHHLMYCVAQVGKRVTAETFEAFRLLTEENLNVSQVCERMAMNSDQVYKIKSRLLGMIREELMKFESDE